MSVYELRVKAASIGIHSADFPHAFLEDIVFGWEAKKLELYHMSRPAIEAQLAKLSPISLAKAEDEKESAEDRKYGTRGAVIKAQLAETMHFNYMPQYMQVAWINRHKRFPGADTQKAKPIDGLSKELASEIVKFSEMGYVPDRKLNDPKDTYPSVWRVIARLEATKKRG